MKLHIRVGETFDTMTARFVEIAERAEDGRPFEPDSGITFADWPTFFKALTPNRIAMLEHVYAQDGVPSVRAIATALHRDYRRVHDDVEALTKLGLLSRSESGISTDVDVREAAFLN